MNKYPVLMCVCVKVSLCNTEVNLIENIGEFNYLNFWRRKICGEWLNNGNWILKEFEGVISQQFAKFANIFHCIVAIQSDTPAHDRCCEK